MGIKEVGKSRKLATWQYLFASRLFCDTFLIHFRLAASHETCFHVGVTVKTADASVETCV